ncbi:MAG TPA: hypothetical protein VN256_22310 [Pyrinomonadaceae bacterium]|nr:hypothetical protein [Pyrinomonadaceae bacterium]
MPPLTAPQLLDAWEQGLGRPQVERAILLLAAATGEPADELARLSIGRRDALLLDAREQVFGPRLTSVSACPACGERMEATFEVSDLRVEPEGVDGRREDFELSVNGYRIRFRLPDSLDQASLAACADVAAARDLLLRRCLLGVSHGGEEGGAESLPPDVLEAVARRMEEMDPQADLRLGLSCGACGHAWEEAFDIGSFFCTELDAWASRVLTETHTLARAYGWSEGDILMMSAARRQFYLNLVGT